jgi:glycosyltransferase involved in cell wall biosynthesis
LKIGIDGRILSRPITGIGRYTLEMCKALARIEGISLYIYSHSPISAAITKKLEPAIIKTGRIENQVLRQIWAETLLPLWAKRDRVDVFWGPGHRLPHWLPSNITSFVTIHDLAWKYAGQTMRWVSRIMESYHMPIAIKKADHVIADSKATADAILDNFNTAQNKVTVVSLGADHLSQSTDIKLLEKLHITKDYFLFVGTIEPRKNLCNLLTAYAEFSESVKKQAMLVIAGGAGWGDVDLVRKITELNLAQHTIVLGYVDESTLAALYANAKFLVMPSLYEGFGLPLAEAMVYGTPVLTSNNSSMIEVAGNAGLLVDPLDIKSIKEGLLQLISDDHLCEQLSINAKRNAVRFNWQASADQLLTVFKSAVSIKKSRKK